MLILDLRGSNSSLEEHSQLNGRLLLPRLVARVSILSLEQSTKTSTVSHICMQIHFLDLPYLVFLVVLVISGFG